MALGVTYKKPQQMIYSSVVVKTTPVKTKTCPSPDQVKRIKNKGGRDQDRNKLSLFQEQEENSAQLF